MTIAHLVPAVVVRAGIAAVSCHSSAQTPKGGICVIRAQEEARSVQGYELDSDRWNLALGQPEPPSGRTAMNHALGFAQQAQKALRYRSAKRFYTKSWMLRTDKYDGLGLARSCNDKPDAGF